MKQLLELYNHEMDLVSDRLKQGEGYMIIEDWQEGLKKITFRVTWKNEDGTDGRFEQTAYYERDSNYDQGE
ncbi:MAG: hypothetical protein HY784_11300 [Chloroflexi bacterium]|nr:hypothetical protein [Chloroflexota bacterium]